MSEYYVYVLYSSKFDKIYVGQTCDISNRLREHNNGLSGYTKRYIPWKLIYTEKFSNRGDALKREKQLKSSRGRSFIWREILGINKY
jgi:putative endonuclease